MLYIIMNLTQLERMKSELKQRSMEKTRLQGLNGINHRSQGVAEKICNTQRIVLVKLIKLGVRSIKGCWLDLDEGI
jgi:hypothetical protein